MKITNYSKNTFSSFNNDRKGLEAEKKRKQQKRNRLVAAASLAGAIVPLAIYNAKKGKVNEIKDVFQKEGSKFKDKALAATGLLEVEDIKQIGISVTGSIAAGMVAGCAGEHNKKNRTAKYKEGIYSFLNCLIPMGIIAGAEKIARKNNIRTGVVGTVAIAAGGIAGGMLATNKIANGINKALFKEDKFEKRKMEPKDLLVHSDDILGVLVISKVPFAKQAGKLLPLVYAHLGHSTGTETATIEKTTV